MILAVIIVASQSGEWGSLPFINPVLWLDWVAMWAFSGLLWIPLALISLIIGAALFSLTLWLSIGYGGLGYGTLQYDIINVPPLCDPFSSRQTDPRQFVFMIMHEIYFGIAIFAFVLIIATIRRIPPGNEIPKTVNLVIAVCFILPPTIGMAFAAYEHSGAYLFLVQGGCYSSYVSGQFGYLNSPSVSWKLKAATLVGVNI